MPDQWTVDDDRDERVLPLQALELGGEPGELPPERLPSRAGAVAPRRGGLARQYLQPLAHCPDFADKVALALPPLLQRRHAALGLGSLLSELPQPLGVIRADSELALEDARLHCDVVQRPHGVFQRSR